MYKYLIHSTHGPFYPCILSLGCSIWVLLRWILHYSPSPIVKTLNVTLIFTSIPHLRWHFVTPSINTRSYTCQSVPSSPEHQILTLKIVQNIYILESGGMVIPTWYTNWVSINMRSHSANAFRTCFLVTMDRAQFFLRHICNIGPHTMKG